MEALKKGEWVETLETPFMDISTALTTPVVCKDDLDLILFMLWEVRFRVGQPTRTLDRDQVMLKTIRWENPVE